MLIQILYIIYCERLFKGMRKTRNAEIIESIPMKKNEFVAPITFVRYPIRKVPEAPPMLPATPKRRAEISASCDSSDISPTMLIKSGNPEKPKKYVNIKAIDTLIRLV